MATRDRDRDIHTLFAPLICLSSLSSHRKTKCEHTHTQNLLGTYNLLAQHKRIQTHFTLQPHLSIYTLERKRERESVCVCCFLFLETIFILHLRGKKRDGWVIGTKPWSCGDGIVAMDDSNDRLDGMGLWWNGDGQGGGSASGGRYTRLVITLALHGQLHPMGCHANVCSR